MRTFAVSYINWFDHELDTQFIQAENEIEAACQRLLGAGYELDQEAFLTLEDVKHFAFDCDSMVHAVELPSAV